MKRLIEDAAIGASDAEPDEVAQAALHALSGLTIRDLISLAARVNQGHQYRRSRNSLVAMLDRALARTASPR